MKKAPAKSIPRVALLIESSRAYGRELLLGIAKYAKSHGPWSIEFHEGDPAEHFPAWFDRWEWDGVIARVSTPTIAAALIRCGAPVVDLNGKLPDSPFPQIRSDEETVGRLAAEHLLERGFKNFAFCGFSNKAWSDKRRASFERRVADAGFSCHTFTSEDPSLSLGASKNTPANEKSGRDLMVWLRALPKPCGLMACNDAHGRLILGCCREAEMQVPHDIAVIGVDKDDVFSELSGCPLSSVILNTQQIGFEAAALLTRMMAGDASAPAISLVQPIGVMKRQSTDVLAIDDPHIATALQHIREHACEGLHVDSLLKLVPLSRSVLERRFAKLLGTSPNAEIVRVRLDCVCRLLAESDRPLAEIAQQTGFEHPEYMGNLFKKKMGITPGEFRKRARPTTAPNQ